jgi:hypothetical protein
VLGASHRLRVRQCRQGLVPFRWQEQPFEIPAEAVALIVLPEEGIELLTVGLKRSRGGRHGEATGHGSIS